MATVRFSSQEFFYIRSMLRLNEIKTVDSLYIPFGLQSDTSIKYFNINSSPHMYVPKYSTGIAGARDMLGVI